MAGYLLVTISYLANSSIEISSDLFTEILEITLHCIVEAVPDSLSSLELMSEKTSKFLSNRCIEAAMVVKSLFGHIQSSWLGLNRLTQAVSALGINSHVPIICWICVRIISIVLDEAGTVSLTDMEESEELVDVLAALIGRLEDTFKPVTIEATNAVEKILQRWEITAEKKFLTINNINLKSQENFKI
jgi:hypothetical protein